jgi:HAD superfamily hydrolase (TIGR01509 family)
MNLGVIFDLDGVIMDNNAYHEKSWQIFCDSNGIHLSDKDMQQFINGRRASDALDFIFNGNCTNAEKRKHQKLINKIYRDIYRKEIQPVDGLYPFLEELKESDIPVVLATSAPRGNVDFAFRHILIRDYFKTVLSAEDIYRGKPDPEIYCKAIQETGLSSCDCVVFEDSMSGVASALEAGAHVIGVATTLRKEDFSGTMEVINSFEEINVKKILSLIIGKK